MTCYTSSVGPSLWSRWPIWMWRITSAFSLSLCPCQWPPTTTTHAPPIPPPPASPAVQQQRGRWGWGSAAPRGVPWSDLPGVAAAFPPAGCSGLRVRPAAAAVSIQLGRACEVSSSAEEKVQWERDGLKDSYLPSSQWKVGWSFVVHRIFLKIDSETAAV